MVAAGAETASAYSLRHLAAPTTPRTIGQLDQLALGALGPQTAAQRARIVRVVHAGHVTRGDLARTVPMARYTPGVATPADASAGPAARRRVRHRGPTLMGFTEP
jgi:hypothetical protein